ncbi:putative UDP-N-acetylglucosamine pyrophosphorylase [Neospora caninum Liverpool]|uniref:UTP-monosaccharide-1-phosphate uridylyltransferase n=1 Tax=Neospora caninum (strain Liverpool) TaxID=572307 RepID=F0VPY2_NEOCL|nr:putative UDP-N-acetylglucosamine pyrophosphorylase [Neospora caninum Liverpool]CBZ55779.1 putative UDP-N-acetylglucosamine pyrophosphorylase [Neospora caninum Liverpool]CEL70523.1 TPA: UDP-N-acetylglucosamine pyrophosphorylase,putative [Neospora caninum Liverpool]|eukprot:XP_003885805.1 putative UDP-N-acetylglucosamine pyrophosphorylase [Neospora caninum Liverpool]
MATACKDEEWQRRLEEMGQAHLLPPDARPQDLRRLFMQLEQADSSYPGGLCAYISRARTLLAASQAGANPFEGCTAYKPAGERVEVPSPLFDRLEALGSEELHQCAFVLVAGGLGERLGYNGIKIGLPCETTTAKTFAQLYCEYLLAIQTQWEERKETEGARESLEGQQSSGKTRRLFSGCSPSGGASAVPLAIMTSEDTHDRTVALFEQHAFFGLQREQVTFMKQGKVPALRDNEARIATSAADPFEVLMKPHGHGDVHTLLHQHGLVERWKREGKKWIVFFQDTNALIFRALPATLGVSKQHSFAMNTITVPRKPSEAMGAICKLQKADGSSITINVEYNVLGPLLKAEGRGDDPTSDGFSCFPGNTNALVFSIEPYCSALQRTGGTVPEFVNPKYKDSTKTSFKSPTRLECMMQDFPRLFSPTDPVGFTELDRWFCYSSVKNNAADAKQKIAAGIPPECALSGEADLYWSNARLLALAAESAGAKVEVEEAEAVCAREVTYPMGPRVVLAPSWGLSEACMRRRLQGAATLKLSSTSTLIVEGDVFIKHLELDGAAVLRAAPGAKLVVNKLVVKNEGWPLRILQQTQDAPPATAMRGYTFDHKGTYTAENTEVGTTKTINEG